MCLMFIHVPYASIELKGTHTIGIVVIIPIIIMINNIELLLRRRSTILSFICFAFYISLEFITLVWYVRLFFSAYSPSISLSRRNICTQFAYIHTSHRKVSQQFPFSSSCRRCRQRSLCLLRPLCAILVCVKNKICTVQASLKHLHHDYKLQLKLIILRFSME